MDQEQPESELIHLPILPLESLLAERGHPLSKHQDLWDVDARELFDGWAVRRGYRDSSSNISATDELHSGDGRRRRLQDIIGDGTHFIKLYVGNPAQVRVLALSSAADLTAWPCEDCYNCGNLIPPYFQSKSNTFSTMPCGRCATGKESSDACDSKREHCVVSATNGIDSTSSWTAYESRDFIYVGGAEETLGGMEPMGSDVAERYGFPLVFGCQTEAKGWYASQVHDGIVGLSSAKTSFVNQMVFQDKLKYPRFTMCFEKGTRGGIVTLGGFNPKTLDSPMVYVQNVEVEGNTGFKVYVRNVYLRKGGGQSLNSDGDGISSNAAKLDFDADQFNAHNQGTIVDSGLPLLVLDEGIQESFLKEWKRITGSDFSFGKMRLSESDILSMPTLIFQIKAHDGVDKSFDPNTVSSLAGDRDPEHPFDVMIAIPATHYLEYIPALGTYRSKITLDSKIGSFIGMVAMEGHAFYYDLTTDRIGMAESFNCQPKSGLSGFGDDDMFALPTIESGVDLWNYNPNGPTGSGGDIDIGSLSTAHNDHRGGSCTSATCISFVIVGYALVVVALAVALKKYRPRDLSKKFEESVLDDSDTVFGRESESLNPDFQKHVRHENVDGLA